MLCATSGSICLSCREQGQKSTHQLVGLGEAETLDAKEALGVEQGDTGILQRPNDAWSDTVTLREADKYARRPMLC